MVKKNHHLAKAISDVSWYELTRQLEYKKANGMAGNTSKLDTFLCSSQICSVCVSEFGHKRFVGEGDGYVRNVGWNMTGISILKYTGRRNKTNSIRNK